MKTAHPVESATFSAQVEGRCGIVTLKDGAFDMGTDLEEKKRFLSTFGRLEASPDIGALVCFNASEALGDDAHRRFFESAGPTANRSTTFETSLSVREANALNEFLLRITESTKLIAICLQGTIATPFFGLSLASDVRLATPDMRFHLSHTELGIPPSASLAFLLPRFVGQGRATEMLLAGGTISADQAKELGLVHQIVASTDFEAACLQVVEERFLPFAKALPWTRPLFSPMWMSCAHSWRKRRNLGTMLLGASASDSGLPCVAMLIASPRSSAPRATRSLRVGSSP